MLVEAHRWMSAREKMRRVLSCNAAAEAMARAGIRARHGPLPDRDLRLHLAALRLGPEAMMAAFGWREQDQSASADG